MHRSLVYTQVQRDMDSGEKKEGGGVNCQDIPAATLIPTVTMTKNPHAECMNYRD